MDVVDPREAPGVGTPVQGGITYREAHLAMKCYVTPADDVYGSGGGESGN